MLPFHAAMSVVLQGIRVRFGRSVVTVMGVALGIAFLMSILSAQVIKTGVAGEQALRNEVTRMFNVMVAEGGLPRSMVLGLVELGPLSPVETRLVARMAAAGPRELRRGPAAGVGATALLVVGEGAVDPGRMAGLLGGARRRMVFFTRAAQGVPPGDGGSILLAREPSPEEREKLAVEERKARFRNVWIVVISLFVTVIGITNSMLMSVTERFREIGTMKCLGALSAFVRHLFLIESSLVGLVGAVAGTVAGTVAGALFSMAAYSVTYGFGLVFASLDPARLALYGALCIVAGVGMAVGAALYPARFASRMLPAHALRSEI
jgi:hypothetical protein